MKSRAYLFDFDGTLVDTMDGFADIAGRVINEYHPGISFEEGRKNYLDTSGVPFAQQLEIMFPGDSKNSEKAAIFEETKKEGFFSQNFSEDVKYTINTLRENGCFAVVSSNNFQTLIDKFVNREGLVFDVVLGFRDGFQKGKDHFDFVREKFSLLKNEVTFTGDSLKDAEKAMSYGIDFIGLCGTFKREDFQKIDPNIVTINNLREVLTH